MNLNLFHIYVSIIARSPYGCQHLHLLVFRTYWCSLLHNDVAHLSTCPNCSYVTVNHWLEKENVLKMYSFISLACLFFRFLSYLQIFVSHNEFDIMFRILKPAFLTRRSSIVIISVISGLGKLDVGAWFNSRVFRTGEGACSDRPRYYGWHTRSPGSCS